MFRKVRIARTRRCHSCGLESERGDIMFEVRGSGLYHHNVCVDCVKKEIKKEIAVLK